MVSAWCAGVESWRSKVFAEWSIQMNMLDDIEVDITVELGATTMPIHHLLRMGRGAVIELDTTERDPMRIYANNKLVARGDVRVEDGNLTVEVLEKVVSHE